jgi:hypothetical protein
MVSSVEGAWVHFTDDLASVGACLFERNGPEFSRW